MGLSIVMGRVVASGHIKVLIAGLGWAAADLFLTRALPLWVGARGLEFDWKYIQISLDANISLVRAEQILLTDYFLKIHNFYIFFPFFSLLVFLFVCVLKKSV